MRRWLLRISVGLRRWLAVIQTLGALHSGPRAPSAYQTLGFGIVFNEARGGFAKLRLDDHEIQQKVRHITDAGRQHL